MRGGRALAALLLALLCAGCNETLFSRLDGREAVEMQSILLERGVRAERVLEKDGTTSLQVPRADVARAVEILNAHHYPRERFASLGQVFSQQGLIPSPMEERARFIFALSQELSRTISEIDGVITARVHVVLPRNDPAGLDAQPAAAAVFIRYDDTRPLEGVVPQIKTLVAASIEGLSYDKVAVVLVPAAPAREPAARPDSAGPFAAAPDGGTLGLAGGAAVLLVGGAWVAWRRRRGAAVPDAPALPSTGAQPAGGEP